jgi:ribosomal protein S17E
MCALGGNNGLGKIRTVRINRLAKELARRFPNKFPEDFESNKHAAERLTQETTPKLGNKIAGYITHVFAGTPTASSDNTEDCR